MKRSYILFELLAAFFLLSCILFPLLKTHFVLMGKEIERVEKIQIDRLKENSFALLREKFYENKEFPFLVLKKGVQGVLSENVCVYTAKNRCKKFRVHFDLKPLESCRRKKGHYENYLLLEAKLSFIPYNKKKGYDYTTTFLLREYE